MIDGVERQWMDFYSFERRRGSRRRGLMCERREGHGAIIVGENGSSVISNLGNGREGQGVMVAGRVRL